MKILVIGAGSIGRRHINNLNTLGYEDIDVLDINNINLDLILKGFKINRIFNNSEEVKYNKYDIGFVLTPPIYHMDYAMSLAQEGVNLFIEKPLSHNLKNVNNLIDISEKNKLIVAVGYNLKFQNGIKKLKSSILNNEIGKIYHISARYSQYLPDWRKNIDYSKNYTAIKKLGGGILLDGSHEIDYINWLANSRIKEVKSIFGKKSNLNIDVEDCADILLQYENNITANIHLDMIEQGYNRNCEIIGENGNLKWDFSSNIFEYYNGLINKLKVKRLISKNDSYIDELKHFLNCIKNNSMPLSNIYTAKETLKTIIKCKNQVS